MSNGNDYARLVLSLEKMLPIQDFQISWNDFCKVCVMFDKKANVKVAENKVTFVENKTKFICYQLQSDYNKGCNFNFSFEKAKNINMDNVFILQNQKSMFAGRYAIKNDKAISSDGFFCFVSKMNGDVGDDFQQFFDKFPKGNWLYNKDTRLIVSEDKTVACTHKRAEGAFPMKALEQLAQQPLNNYFECNSNEFNKILQKCSQVGEKIKIIPKDEAIEISVLGQNNTDLTIEMPCTYHHKTTKKEIRLLVKYAEHFEKCSIDNNLKILFDDSEKNFMIRMENEDLKIFGTCLER